jgi:hypothetical protein
VLTALPTVASYAWLAWHAYHGAGE